MRRERIARQELLLHDRVLRTSIATRHELEKWLEGYIGDRSRLRWSSVLVAGENDKDHWRCQASSHSPKSLLHPFDRRTDMVLAPRHPWEKLTKSSTFPFCRKSYLYLGNTYVPLQRVQEELEVFDRRIHDGNGYWWTGRFACSVVEELYSNVSQILGNLVQFLLLPSFVRRCGSLALAGRGKSSRHDSFWEAKYLV